MTLRKAIFVTAVLAMCLSLLPSAFAHTVNPANGNANAKTREVLNWLAHLPNRTSNKVVSGHFGGYSSNGFSMTQTNDLYNKTGQFPGIFACDYGAGWATANDPTTKIDYACNTDLKTYWNNGGLITINIHYPSPGNANGGGLNTKLTNFGDMLNVNTDTGRRWRAYLDKTAQGLQDLKNAGVTVLFRPLHEMNGDWFWWGNQDAATFRNVWINMYNYLTTTKGLNNLIWIYSPDISRGNKTAYYPGSSYVDIVGLDAYSDFPDVEVQGYDELVSLGKPFAFTEIGPDTLNGSFDYMKWLNVIKTKYPKTVYFLAWNDGWGPNNNKNSSPLMNDAWVVNRGEVNLASITEPSGSGGGGGGTELSLYTFEGANLQGWTGRNVTAGPWAVTEWKSGGSYSLKADATLGTGAVYLQKVSAHNFTGKTTLRAKVKHAAWGNQGNGMTAKLYVKVSGAWTWYDGGAVAINGSTSTTLTLNLGAVPNLNDVREIGVQFIPASNSSGNTAVYVDDVTIQ